MSFAEADRKPKCRYLYAYENNIGNIYVLL